MSRPSRSDAHLSPVDEAVRVDEVRGYYDGAAPKRHSKPSRSDHSAVYTDALAGPGADGSHPELDKFQDLEAHSEKLVCEGGKAGEEFVETEYYKDLGCVGKQHHTAAELNRGRWTWCRLARASSRWTGPPAPRSSSPRTRMRRSAMLPPRETPPQTSGSRQLTRCIRRSQTSPTEATAEPGNGLHSTANMIRCV
ncbi:uncharacterized protein [Triticum aestivum]|uniref:uncharacterized protein isoform X1 n=1 Tax=Triticum aestivum TaxID=4565 RepID=UPI001D01A9BC|nr:uncharacterized protein LOC123085384 isoform X1 [Triticum aestivum]